MEWPKDRLPLCIVCGGPVDVRDVAWENGWRHLTCKVARTLIEELQGVDFSLIRDSAPNWIIAGSLALEVMQGRRP
jgi:hypothetical protein